MHILSVWRAWLAALLVPLSCLSSCCGHVEDGGHHPTRRSELNESTKSSSIPASKVEKTKKFNASIIGNPRFQNYSSLLLVGDSVDREAVLNWCSANRGVMCFGYSIILGRSPNETHSYIPNSADEKVPRLCFDIMEDAAPIINQPQQLDNTYFCVVSSRQLIVASIFNSHGVRSSLACFATGNNLNELAYDVDYNTSYFFDLRLKPSFTFVAQALTSTGRLDGIVMQSGFWDLAREYRCGCMYRRFQSPATGRFDTKLVDPFRMEWASNATRLIGYVRESLQHAGWLAWRTLNQVSVYRGENEWDPNRWNTKHANTLIEHINIAARHLTVENNLTLIEFQELSRVQNLSRPFLRDHAHPNNLTSAVLVEFILGAYRFSSSSIEASKSVALAQNDNVSTCFRLDVQCMTETIRPALDQQAIVVYPRPVRATHFTDRTEDTKFCGSVEPLVKHASTAGDSGGHHRLRQHTRSRGHSRDRPSSAKDVNT
jgi:hypothetical protein